MLHLSLKGNRVTTRLLREGTFRIHQSERPCGSFRRNIQGAASFTYVGSDQADKHLSCFRLIHAGFRRFPEQLGIPAANKSARSRANKIPRANVFAAGKRDIYLGFRVALTVRVIEDARKFVLLAFQRIPAEEKLWVPGIRFLLLLATYVVFHPFRPFRFCSTVLGLNFERGIKLSTRKPFPTEFFHLDLLLRRTTILASPAEDHAFIRNLWAPNFARDHVTLFSRRSSVWRELLWSWGKFLN